MPYPEDESQPIDLRGFLAVLRRRRWLVILPTLLTVVAALASVGMRTPLYSSTVRVEVLPRTAQENLAPTYGGVFANMDTESARVTSTQIEGRAADLLVVHGYSATLATDAGVTVSVPVNTAYLDIACTTERAAAAQACAQAYAGAYVADRKTVVDRAAAALRKPLEAKIAGATVKIAALDTQIASTNDPDVRAKLEHQQTVLQQTLASAQLTLDGLPRASDRPAQIVTPAGLPTEPSNKGFIATGILAGILGIALGIGLAFVRQRMDERVGEQQGLDAILGTPVLAVIPHLGGRGRNAELTVVSMTDPDGHAAEAYRSARPMLLHRARQHDVKTILVTGPGPGEGKSTTTANLGVVLARSGYRVVMLSCDLRKPALHRLFGLASEPGLSDVLAHRIALPDALVRTGVPNLLLLPSGALPANPSELLASGAMAAVVEAMRTHADFVLLDTPPSLVVADALELAPVVDGILVVVDGSKTVGADVLRLRRQLDQVGGRLLGCVLNNLDSRAASPYGSYGGGAYGYVRYGSDDGRRREEREREDWGPSGSFARSASGANTSRGPAPIEEFDQSPNGNGKLYVLEEPVLEPASEPARRPVRAPEQHPDDDMWR